MPLITYVLSQREYPGAGDLDDCWVVSIIQGQRSCAPWLDSPTIPEFRRNAGDPDDGVRDGGHLDEWMKGIQGTWPKLPVTRVSGWRWETFAAEMRSEPQAASVAVASKFLPAHLQYGFTGLHQVTVEYDRGWWIANPLQAEGSGPRVISETALKAAITAYGNGYVYGVIFPTPAEARAAYAMPIYTQRSVGGTFTIKRGTIVRGWRPKADGSGWEVAKTLARATADSSARFSAQLVRLAGTSTPSNLLKVANGILAGLYVSTAEVVETFDTAPTVSRDALEAAQQEAARLAQQLSIANSQLAAERAEDATVAAVLRKQAEDLTN